MRYSLRKQATDGARALRSRAFLTFLAILTLCATPLGTGELFAASSHLFERRAIAAWHGDLPRRVATPHTHAQTGFLEDSAQATSLVALADDSPDAIGIESPVFAHCQYCEGTSLALAGLFGRFDPGFEARGPPLG